MQGDERAAVLTALAQAAPVLERLEAALRPIANRKVALADIGKPRPFRPLEEAGVRDEALALLAGLLELYASADEATRAEARALVGRHRAFCWATNPQVPPTTREGLREHLPHVSLLDQGADARDEILRIGHLCASARAAGLDPSPLLREVAALSSDEDRFRMGSTRRFLLDAAD